MVVGVESEKYSCYENLNLHGVISIQKCQKCQKTPFVKNQSLMNLNGCHGNIKSREKTIDTPKCSQT